MGRWSCCQDLSVLWSLWFKRVKGDTHADRLNAFYRSQASGYDDFRKRFLWAREPLLEECSRAVDKGSGLVWVDLGGGTGQNVLLMKQYIPLERFSAIYVVDLCHFLCEEAKAKVEQNGFKNVHVVEEDACTFEIPQEFPKADLVTFSYALSMIPNFFVAVDHAKTLLKNNGILGVCDFYVSLKHDVPSRQMSWVRRFFWQSIFDLDGVHLGPERRMYLEHELETLWERNGDGPIPYALCLRPPWYAWTGRKRN